MSITYTTNIDGHFGLTELYDALLMKEGLRLGSHRALNIYFLSDMTPFDYQGERNGIFWKCHFPAVALTSNDLVSDDCVVRISKSPDRLYGK